MTEEINLSGFQQTFFCENRLLEETKAKTKDLLTCPLCRLTFKDPRTLPCGDAFCVVCLQRYVFGLQGDRQSLKFGSFSCPKCSAQIGLPSAGVTSFPKDTRVDVIRERAVEEMTRKLARERAVRTGQLSEETVESDHYMDLDIGETRDDEYSDLSSISSRYSYHRSPSFRLNRNRPGYASVRESRGAGLRYSKSFTGGLRPSEKESCGSSDLDERTKDAERFSSELDHLREFVKIERNRTFYSSLRDRRRRSDLDETHSVLNSQFFESPRSRFLSSNSSSTRDMMSDTYSRASDPLLEKGDLKENSELNCQESNFSEFSRRDSVKSDDQKGASLIDSIFADLAQGRNEANVESHLARFRRIFRAGSLRETSTRSYRDIIRNDEQKNYSRNYWNEPKQSDYSTQNGAKTANKEKHRDESDGIENPQSMSVNRPRVRDLPLHSNSSSLDKNDDAYFSSNGSISDARLKTENGENNSTLKNSSEISASRQKIRNRPRLTEDLFIHENNSLLTSSNSNTACKNFAKAGDGKFSETHQKSLLENENSKLTSMYSQHNDLRPKSDLDDSTVNCSNNKQIYEETRGENKRNDMSSSGTPSVHSEEKPEITYEHEGRKLDDEEINDMFDFLPEHEEDKTGGVDHDSAVADNSESSDTLSATSEVPLDESGIIEYTPESPTSNNDLKTVDFRQSSPGDTEVEHDSFSHVLETTLDESGQNNEDAFSHVNSSKSSSAGNVEMDHLLQRSSGPVVENNGEPQENPTSTSRSPLTYSNTHINANSPNTNASGESDDTLINHNSSKSSSDNSISNLRRSRVEAGVPVNTGSAELKEVRGGDCVTPTAVVSMENVSVVADYGGSNLQYLFEDGSPSHSINSLKPFSLAVTRDGERVFVGDRKHRTVAVFDCYGSDVAQWDSNIFPWISGIGTFRNGNLAVLDRSKCTIGIYSAGSELLTEFGSYGAADNQLCMAEFLAVDNRDRIIVSDSGNHCVKIFSSTGQLLGVCGKGRGTADNGQLQWPKGVCTDDKDNIIVADCCNNRVSMFSSEGIFLEHLVTSIRYPYGVSYSSNRNLLFVTLQSMSRTNSYHAYALSSRT